MKRVRISKEKNEYRQIVYPEILGDKDKNMFTAYLPQKLMVSDKKVKELKMVGVRFKILNTW